MSIGAMLWGYVLAPSDKDILERTHALKTLYIVVDRGIPCGCEAENPPALVDDFVTVEDFFDRPETKCKDDKKWPYSPHNTLQHAKKLKCELEDVFRVRQAGRSVEVKLVYRRPMPVMIRQKLAMNRSQWVAYLAAKVVGQYGD